MRFKFLGVGASTEKRRATMIQGEEPQPGKSVVRTSKSLYDCIERARKALANGRTPDQWEALKGAFEQALGSPQIVSLFTELRMHYGDV